MDNLKLCGCYLITNLINGKVYVGQSVDIYSRWNGHKRHKKDTRINRAFKKYGVSAFKFEVLIECPQSSLDFLETAFIQGYNSYDKAAGYNASLGGDSCRGYVATAETRAKIAEAGKGRKHSEETKAKMSMSATGRRIKPEVGAKIGEANRRRVVSTETRQKMAAAHFGIPNVNKGKHVSPEAHQRMREGQIKRRDRESKMEPA